MPEHLGLETLARKLLLRGFPPRYIHNAVREIAEHWEDLKMEALARGLSRPEAEAWAAARIGDASTLAGSFQRIMRGSSWFGRHPITSFCLLPFAAIVIWWALFMLGVGWTSGALQWADNNSLPEPDWPLLQQSLRWCSTGAATFLPLIFCWVARRSFSGFGWAGIACGILALHNGLQFASLTPPGSAGDAGFTIGYSIQAGLLADKMPGFALPFLVLFIFLLLHLKLKTKSIKQKL